MIITLAEKYIKSKELFKRIEQKLDNFKIFKKIVFSWNRKINLTSYDENDFYFHAIIENLLIFDKFKSSGDFLDIGTGFGNPSVSIAITFPEIKVYCSEINKKRLSFLFFLKNELNIQNLHIYSGNIEKNNFDVITARAFKNYLDFFKFIEKNNIKSNYIWLFFKENMKDKLNKIIYSINYIYKNKTYSQVIIKF